MEMIDSDIRSIPKFIRDKLGRKVLNWWLKALKEGLWMIYEGTILAGSWYPIKEIVVTPTQKLPIPGIRKLYIDL
jgi:hypothetical protein